MTSPPRTGLWRHPDFVKLWVGQSVSVLGTMVTRTALPLAAILVLGSSPAQQGLLRAAEAAPTVLVGLFAGAWVDRLRRRPVMIAADLGRALLAASIPAAALLGHLTMAHLYAVAAAAAALTVFFDAAYPSYLPTLVGRDRILEANRTLGMSASIAEMGGFSLGGLLVGLLGAPLAMLADAGSFLVSAGGVALVRAPEPAPPAPESREGMFHEVAEGMRAVATDPRLRALAASGATFSFFGGFFALYFLFATSELGLGPKLLGVVIACGGIGAFAGAALAERVAKRFGLGRTLVWSLALGGLFQGLVPLAHGPELVAAAFLVGAQVLGDCGLAIFMMHEVSLRQSITPDRLLGRVNATVNLVAGGALPLGALVGGLLGELVGMRATVAVGAAGIALACLWIAASPVRSMREAPEPAGAA